TKLKNKRIQKSSKEKRLEKVRNLEKMEEISIDMAGPEREQTNTGRRYVLYVVDLATGYIWTELLTHKSEAVDALRKLIVWSRTQFGGMCPIKRVKTDNDAVFTGKS